KHLSGSLGVVPILHSGANPVAQANPANRTARYVWGPYADFWALGGASILLWALILVADAFRNVSPSATTRLGQLTVVFSLMSVFVNYPHFIISYRFGYGRGAKFILRNWFSLIVVPLGMIATFGVAYFCFDYDVSSSKTLLALDTALSSIGIDLSIKYRGALGREILLGSIWTMYFTVGWHYSKQVFGCLMVYAKLRGYFFSHWDRTLLKWNLFAVAFYQFSYLNRSLLEVGSSADPRFPGILITGFELPSWSYGFFTALLLCTTLGALWIFAKIAFVQKKRLDANFLVPWASFLVWWVPLKNLPEFYFLAVPFFHSLQYLLFASKLESKALEGRPNAKPKMIILVVLTVIAGVAGFELVPSALDSYLATSSGQSTWFFVSVAGVFLNVHHFFIDSAVWKFGQREVQEAFFPQGSVN
ncbi:MAG: hypothetical protein ACXVCI_20975, partial [Bdellovibrionota bacterium]